MDYLRRVLDQELDELLPGVAAIAIEGAKGVGKTATALRRAQSTLRLDDPARHSALTADLDLVTRLEPPVLIDEWQLVPPVWDRVRRAVDDDPTGGRFLLTGSAHTPSSARLHSGAGRIIRLHMRPLSMAERFPNSATVSTTELLSAEAQVDGRSELAVPDYAREILRSGFPGIRDLPDRARRAQLDSYAERIVEHELADSGVTIRSPEALRAWLTAYASATSSDASYSAVLDAATPAEADKPSRQTVSRYREHLARLFVVDPVPAWTPTFAPLKRLAKTPKHHLVDPALAARLVGLGERALLQGDGHHFKAEGSTFLGALFESLVTQSVRTYAQTAEARVGHLRTRNGDHEIDLIIENPDMSIIGIEVKLKPSVVDRDVVHLHWLKAQMGSRMIDQVVINTGEYAYRRPDGVAVIPLALLGP
ncbi:ATP-binding protein [Gordonia phthalatica]|uniref:ATPase AAA n=1 Tax=Gordonia phthalatica TaxID=1136941 RepID=A0A0N9MND5_9ACTN|nr:DUF4143 domain-containing protein [Gordonia phthalatica]ALG83585.1 ATPase AAA [Gordonia phthalatica]